MSQDGSSQPNQSKEVPIDQKRTQKRGKASPINTALNTNRSIEDTGPPKHRRLGYVRVSTTEQTIGMQVRALEYAGCDRIYIDQGVSGASWEREGLDDLFEAIRPGDTLVVWKLDRLGRSLASLIFTLRGLHESGVEFLSLRDAIDTSTAGGRLSFHIMGALAEFERDLISERTLEGMEAAKARGVRIGRPPKLTHAIVETLRLQRDNGMSIPTLAKSLGVHPRTVYRALARV